MYLFPVCFQTRLSTDTVIGSFIYHPVIFFWGSLRVILTVASRLNSSPGSSCFPWLLGCSPVLSEECMQDALVLLGGEGREFSPGAQKPLETPASSSPCEVCWAGRVQSDLFISKQSKFGLETSRPRKHGISQRRLHRVAFQDRSVV